MDVKELKSYIYENRYVEQILENIGCHHIKYHVSGEYWTCANKDGDNRQAIVVRNNDFLFCENYTRQMTKTARKTDLIDLVCYTQNLSFPEALKSICSEIGMSYYHDFEEDIPESFKILKLLEDMDSNVDEEKDRPLKPISESILSYYKSYVNDFFYKDNIDYQTQREFEIGYDEETNRITIPIRSEVNDLVGIKGRLFKENLEDDDIKYLYIEPCNKSKILYGLNKTISYITSKNVVFIFESEKAVLQCWSMGYKNCVSTGGKTISSCQIEMITRLGADPIICFDKDVEQSELEEIADKFIDGISIYAIIDKNNILNEKESPSDDPNKFIELVKNSVYKIR